MEQFWVRRIFMKPKDYREFIMSIPGLSKKMRRRLIAQYERKLSAPQSITEALPGGCPRCQHSKFGKWGFASGLPRFRCGNKDCRRTFNILTGTPLARLRHKEQWLTNAESMMAGLSIRETARRCQVHSKTAFRWRQRFLQLPRRAQFNNLSGIAECDTTYFDYSEKGSRSLKRKARKRGKDAIKSGVSKDKVAVITVRDRAGRGADRVVLSGGQQAPAQELFIQHLKRDTMLITDGSHELCKAARARNPKAHLALPGKQSRGYHGSPYHIQTANGFHSQLKSWMKRFNGVATKYLANYVGWHRHLVERHHQNDPEIFLMLAINPLRVKKQLKLT